MELDEAEESTPRPVTNKQDNTDSDAAGIDDDEPPFETPLARRNRVAKLVPLADIEEITSSESEEVIVKLKVGKQKKTAEREHTEKAWHLSCSA